MYFQVLAAIGALVVVRYVVWLLESPLLLLWGTLRELVVKESLVDKYGSWAVVTGSTDGIGKHYAMELAQRGVNIVLISRNPEKLERVAKEFEELYHVQTKIIVADFSHGPEIYTHIENELKDIPVGILVNNVGLGTEHPMRYCSESPQRQLELVLVNVLAGTMMTRMVLPAMLSRRRGAIVNVSSSAGSVKLLPYAAVYAATKAYTCSLAGSIRREYAGSGLTFQTLTPLFVSSNMLSFSDALTRGNLFVPQARVYARHAIATLGKMSDTCGYWPHGLQYILVHTLPEWLSTRVVSVFTYLIMLDYKKTIRKKEKLK